MLVVGRGSGCVVNELITLAAYLGVDTASGKWCARGQLPDGLDFCVLGLIGVINEEGEGTMANKGETRSKVLRTAGFFLCAFLGGMAAQLLLTAVPAQALGASSWERFFMVKDADNPFGVQTFVQNGGSASKFFDPSGQVRLQMGTYPTGPDAGMPLIALTDEKGKMRVILRLRGERQVPVLIFKDAQERDRLVMGLEDVIGEEPYMTTYDAAGQPIVRFNKLR